jgi:hypothetical protein
MRDWSLGLNSPLFLTLAADARLSAPDYVNDHIWEVELDRGEPRALSLYTTYGLRARSMRLFLRFREHQQAVMDPASFFRPPRLRRFYPNFLSLECAPFRGVEVNIEYWVPESHAIAGRLTIRNQETTTRRLQLELCALLVPLNGRPITVVQQQMVNILAGQTGNLSPVVFLTGGPKHGAGPYPSLMLDLELDPGATRTLTFAQAALETLAASFDLARRTAARLWEAERARIELVNASQMVEIYTGDEEWDAALAFSQRAAFSLFFGPNEKVPHPTFVQCRQPDYGYSQKGDGSDYPPAWNGQTPLEAYYLSSLLPGAVSLKKGVLQNFLATQGADGTVDHKIGLAGQRSKMLAMPLLASLAWKIYLESGEEAFLREVFPRLEKFFWAWFAPQHDRDRDGVPEWDHVLQTGFDENPLFDVWHPWSQGADITCVHSPALEAMLYHEAQCLLQMAERLGKADEMALVRAQAEKLKASLDAAWVARAALYHYRDRDSKLSSAGEMVGRGKGNVALRPKKEFKRPIRLLIEIQTQNPAAKRPEVEIGEFVTKGEVEKIHSRQFLWRSGGLVATSQRVYTRVGKINVSGLDGKDKVIVRSVDLSSEDHTLFLPLWARLPDQQRAQAVIGRALLDAERFDRPFGVPALASLPDAEAEMVGLSVHLPWNQLIGEGLLAYGFRAEAARLVAHLMGAVIQNLKQGRAFYQRYHAERGSGIGERNALHGLAPVGLFLQTLGVTIFSPTRVALEGQNPYPWPVTVKFRGLTVVRGSQASEVIFPNGERVTVTETAPCVVMLDETQEQAPAAA